MLTKNQAISELKQVDNHHFDVQWSDGLKQRFRLSDLQESCPCVTCSQQRETSGKIKVDPNTRVKRVYSVGRYALGFEFDKGCSQGIYTYDLLLSKGVNDEA